MQAIRRTVAAAIGLFAIAGSTAHAQKMLRFGEPLELSGKFVAFGVQGQQHGIETAVEAFGGAVAFLPMAEPKLGAAAVELFTGLRDFARPEALANLWRVAARGKAEKA